MKLDPKSSFFPETRRGVPVDPALSFVSEHYDALWHTARLLGGYDAAKLVSRCTDLLAQERRVTKRTRIMLDQILSVLSLDHIDDPDQPHIGYFAVIDPLDPVVDEICLLTDGLRHALGRLEVEPDLRPVA